MQIPVRCMTCGAVIADQWQSFKKGIIEGKSPKQVLDELGVDRYCCRRMFLTHLDLLNELITHKK